MRKLGSVLTALREKRGNVSYQNIADAAGVSRSTAHFVVTGQGVTSWKTTERIIWFLEGSTKEIEPLWQAARLSMSSMPRSESADPMEGYRMIADALLEIAAAIRRGQTNS